MKLTDRFAVVSGMHRKSIEAAEQLKSNDENSNSSDREENNDTTDKSDASTNNSTITAATTTTTTIPTTTNNKTNAQETNNNHQQQHSKEIINNSRQDSYNNRVHSDRGSSQVINDPEEFRNNSIACLRAKAQEHQAKLLSFSTDALMLVNPQRRMNGSCDVNNISHNQELNSSDNSSSLF